MDLLERDPRARPSGREFLARLGGRSRSTCETSREKGEPAFVGRRAELAALESAYAQACSGRAAIVLVEGPSGAGKSSLVAHFASQLTARRFANAHDILRPLL